MGRVNRYGEVHPKSAVAFEEHDHQTLDWSDDPRSESAHENYLGPLPTRAITDLDIKDEVVLALYLSPDINDEGVVVEVKNRVVSLRGYVFSRIQKISAERCLEQISPIEDIINYLEIKPIMDSSFS